MKEKVHGRLKHKPEDFIVEEISKDYNCSVSKKFNPYTPTDPENLFHDDPKDFIWCEMEKRNIDHFQAIKIVSSLLKKSVRDIGYAGTKDRYAQTSQRISIQKPTYEPLKKFHHTKIILKNFSWKKRKIKLGYLEGNHFEINIRDVDKKDAIKISKEIKKQKWFPNFFGMQRFGSLRKNNVEIGKLILKRKYEEAIWKILTEESSLERPDIQKARKKLKREKNFKESSRYFPNILRIEKQLLFYLSKKPTDFIGALKSCERKNILMFVHSVQSKVFNEILKRALEEGLDFNKEGQKNCVLFGYKVKFSKGRLGEIEKEVLEENNLTPEDFDIREIPYLRIKGSYRKAITNVKELKIKIEDDEEFEKTKKIVLSFNLPSGTYATTYLENFFDFHKSP